MSGTTVVKVKNTDANSHRYDTNLGPTDPKVDLAARDRIVTARVRLLIRQPFFGNISTRLKLVNADEWCGTAGTDGLTLYYSSRFVMSLTTKEVEFLVGHEVLHVVYDHRGRCNGRIQRLWNIACDYAVNSDLKKHNVGTMITFALYDSKYDGMPAEEIYALLLKKSDEELEKLLDQLVDFHFDDMNQGPEPMSTDERDAMRQEIQGAILSAAASAEAGTLPLGVTRLVQNVTDPVMPWRELLQTNMTSAIRTDYTWARPSRRSWHMDAIMPGMSPGEEVDVTIAIDMSGSISQSQAQMFLGEIGGMMDSFSGFNVHVFCFDVGIYNPQQFSSDNLDTIDEYVPAGGGGTSFDCIFDYLKEEAIMPKRLVVFTDGYPYPATAWGDADYCDTTWIIHGDPNPNPPFGQWAIYDDHRK